MKKLFQVALVSLLISQVFSLDFEKVVFADTADTCPKGDGWTKIDSGVLDLHPVSGATAYCFKAGNWLDDTYPDGGFGQDGSCNNGIAYCDLSHWSYFIGPTIEPTVTPTEEPTVTPTDEPTITPTIDPTVTPTDEPTVTPTDEPTVTPTDEPTVTPTDEPNDDPDPTPTDSPNNDPEPTPTDAPGTGGVTPIVSGQVLGVSTMANTGVTEDLMALGSITSGIVLLASQYVQKKRS